MVSEREQREAHWQHERDHQLIAEAERLRALERPEPSQAWSSALGLDSDDDDDEEKAAKAAEGALGVDFGCRRCGILVWKGGRRVDAAVQNSTDLNDAEDDLSGEIQRQQQQQEHSEAFALLEVAREEVHRLKDLNQRLLESRGGEGMMTGR